MTANKNKLFTSISMWMPRALLKAFDRLIGKGRFAAHNNRTAVVKQLMQEEIERSKCTCRDAEGFAQDCDQHGRLLRKEDCQ